VPKVVVVDGPAVLTTVSGSFVVTQTQNPSKETNLVVVLLTDLLVGTLLVVDHMNKDVDSQYSPLATILLVVTIRIVGLVLALDMLKQTMKTGTSVPGTCLMMDI